MNPKMNFARLARTALLLNLIVCGGGLTARAQTVIPRVCVQSSYQTGTTTLAADAAVGSRTITVSSAVPPFVALVINAGSVNEERVAYVGAGSTDTVLRVDSSLQGALNPSSDSQLGRAHLAGETVRFEGYSGKAYFGYNNTSNATVTIPRGVSSHNFLAPGPFAYSEQPSQFLPGIHDIVMTFSFGGLATDSFGWYLDGGEAKAINVAQACGAITYQGRLSEAGAAATGPYDLQFTLFDALTGGAAQNESLTVENVAVTNGVFTVPINFYSSIIHNDKARFLAIGVRAGSATGNDPFTLLTPRQPLTTTPFAINAQTAARADHADQAETAVNATNATNLTGDGASIRLPRITQPPASTISGGCGYNINGVIAPSQLGGMRVDLTNNRLYVCTMTGWKSAGLE